MSNGTTRANVLNVGASTFEVEVVERSTKVPVLVDFWASWCGPCRVLGPVLEQLADEMAGAFVLAKVDTDAEPALSQRFGIRGIPAVKLFVGGAVVDEFVGALPPADVRAFLRRHCPTEADRKVDEARAHVREGALDAARTALHAALALDAAHAGARLELARLALAAGDAAAVEAELGAIPARAPEAQEAQKLREALVFVAECREGGGEDACRRALAADADDLDARYRLGCCLAAAGRYEEALEELLGVVSRNKRHRDEAARKAMVTIFGLVGSQSALASNFRRRLAILL